MKPKPLNQLELMRFPFAQGGRRNGAGRIKTAEDSKPIRVPVSLIPTIQQLIADHKTAKKEAT
jgi:hypothetical protein